jgi:aspartate/methionine/tyrosine aminotransferase
MKDASVLISPGYQFGPGAGGHFRVCYARDEKEWSAALDRMVCVLDRLAKPKGLPALASR